MAISSSITVSERLQRDAVQVLECTIPPDMTLDEWRRLRPGPARRGRRRWPPSRPQGSARHLTLVPAEPYTEPDPPRLAA